MTVKEKALLRAIARKQESPSDAAERSYEKALAAYMSRIRRPRKR